MTCVLDSCVAASIRHLVMAVSRGQGSPALGKIIWYVTIRAGGCGSIRLKSEGRIGLAMEPDLPPFWQQEPYWIDKQQSKGNCT
jgi:hypothetical protein